MQFNTFEEACDFVSSSAPPSGVSITESEKVIMYALYKIGTSGPVVTGNDANPFKRKYRNAWRQMGQTISQEDARSKYIQIVNDKFKNAAKKNTR